MSTFNYQIKFSSSEDEDDGPNQRRVRKTIFDSDSDEEITNGKNEKNNKATTAVKTSTSKQDDYDSDNDKYKPPRRSRKTIFDDSSEDEKQDHLYCFSKPISIDAESDRKKNEPSFISSIGGTSVSSKPSVVESKTSITTTSSTVVKPRKATTDSAGPISIKFKPEEVAPLPYDYKSIITKRISSNPSTTTNSSSSDDPFKYFDVMSTTSSDTTRSARQSSVNADQSNTSYFNLENEPVKKPSFISSIIRSIRGTSVSSKPSVVETKTSTTTTTSSTVVKPRTAIENEKIIKNL